MIQNLSEEIKKIKYLIKRNNLKEAYNLCNKLLINFPENWTLQKLQKKIEKIVFKQNLKAVKNDLKKLKPLWEEKKYPQLINELKKLKNYVPGYMPLEKQIEKATNCYIKYQIQEQKKLLKNHIESIQKYISNKEYEKAISLCKKILLKIPNHRKILELLQKSRALLIDKKIHENENLLNGNDFEKIKDFLESLLKIDPNSLKLKKMLKKASKRENLSLELAKKDYTFKSFEHIKILYQKKKYDKTIKALNELLAFEPNNEQFLSFLEKAKKALNKQVDQEVVKEVIFLQKKFNEQRKNNPQNFIKV
jgi:tetratricopeptide (TPR) repeat protein